EVALVINNKIVSKEHFQLDGERLSIFGGAFADLPNGSYAVAVVFNDDDYTTVEDKIAVTVVNSQVQPSGEEDGGKENPPEDVNNPQE
ncbi:MAG: hypothetical protein K2N94_05755, partial [Lachnospiraceae bacterium]|nr:hypothetical protein [Lachnospiraceae bacterium]